MSFEDNPLIRDANELLLKLEQSTRDGDRTFYLGRLLRLLAFRAADAALREDSRFQGWTFRLSQAAAKRPSPKHRASNMMEIDFDAVLLKAFMPRSVPEATRLLQEWFTQDQSVGSNGQAGPLTNEGYRQRAIRAAKHCGLPLAPGRPGRTGKREVVPPDKGAAGTASGGGKSPSGPRR